MSRFYSERRRRRRWIDAHYAPREQWYPSVVWGRPRFQLGEVQCARLVEEIRIGPRSAGRVKGRCVNDAVRRAPGHGAPLCKGPCVGPQAKADMLSPVATVAPDGTVTTRMVERQPAKQPIPFDSTSIRQYLAMARAAPSALGTAWQPSDSAPLSVWRRWYNEPPQQGQIPRTLDEMLGAPRVGPANHDPGDEDVQR